METTKPDTADRKTMFCIWQPKHVSAEAIAKAIAHHKRHIAGTNRSSRSQGEAAARRASPANKASCQPTLPQSRAGSMGAHDFGKSNLPQRPLSRYLGVASCKAGRSAWLLIGGALSQAAAGRKTPIDRNRALEPKGTVSPW